MNGSMSALSTRSRKLTDSEAETVVDYIDRSLRIKNRRCIIAIRLQVDELSRVRCAMTSGYWPLFSPIPSFVASLHFCKTSADDDANRIFMLIYI